MDLRKREDRVAATLANPLLFGEVYVREYDALWTEDLPAFAGQMLAFAVRVRRGVVILAPEFLKTTLLSQVLPLWLTVRYTINQRMLRGMLLSEEEGMAANNLGVVAWHIENNEKLAHDFRDAKGKPLVRPSALEDTWRDDAIIVQRKGTSKDPTWQAKGLDSKGTQGRRLDWLIGDDVITPKSAFSPAMRKKALDLWDLQLTTRIVKEGRAIIAGNFNDTRDLVSELERRPSYRSFKLPAAHKPGQPMVAADPDEPDAVPTWPQNWPLDRLRQEKRDKPNRYRRIFMLDALAERGERLNTDWVERIAPDVTPLRYCRFFIAVDPAPGGEGDNLDFFNISVGALHGTNLDLVASLDVRAPTPRQVELLGGMHDV